MDIMQLGAIGELVGGVAVIATLVLLLFVVLSSALVISLHLLREAEDAISQKDEALWEAYVERAHAGQATLRSGRRFDGLQAIANAAAIRADLETRNVAIGSLALAGIGIPGTHIGFAGFQSKDIILESAFAAHSGVGGFAAAGPCTRRQASSSSPSRSSGTPTTWASTTKSSVCRNSSISRG